jgi:penicillin-binding protein 1A
MNKALKVYWIVFFSCLAFAFLIILSVSFGLFGKLPDFKELEDPKSSLATQIISSDGELLGTYFKENRTNVLYEEINPNVIKALVATEDERFYSHPGIDVRGLTRAIFFMGSKGGASTISQQLAKLLFTENRADQFVLRVIQKLKEWIIAIELERKYTKEEIITMYLNRFDFVNHAVGIKSAANVYFAKDPNNLEIQEAAMLVGMLKNPSLFNPIKRAEKTLARRNVVLNQMLRSKFITEQAFDSLKQTPLALDYRSVDHKEGIATYFREVLRSEVSKILEEKDGFSYKIKKVDGEKYNVYKDGLKIYTTIDSRMQEYAEWAVKEHLSKELQRKMFLNLKKKKNAPFDFRLSKAEIDKIMQISVSRTSRYRVYTGKECANCGRGYKTIEKITENGQEYFHCTADDCGFNSPIISQEKIDEIMKTPIKMKVFSWDGPKDTLLSPLDSIRYYKSFLQAGFMSMDPHNGHIKAWVGGIDFKNFSFDHVMQSKRQVGSTFKPLVYALALQEGWSPCTELPNVVTCFDMPDGQPPYCPKNSDGVYGCSMTLKYALANSVNTVTAQIMKQFSPQAVVDFAHKVGITSKLDPVPSLCLGVADLSVYELVGANATFANKGVWTEPVFITKIEDKNGMSFMKNTLKKYKP